MRAVSITFVAVLLLPALAMNVWAEGGTGSLPAPKPFVLLAYDANGGSGSYMDNGLKQSAGCEIKNDWITGISRSGHTFSGWNTVSDGTGITYAPGDAITIADDMTLYAQWVSATFKLTYHINSPYHKDYTGVIDTTAEQTVTIGLDTVKPITSVFPQYTGDCDFVVWNTQPDGSGTSYAQDDTMLATDDVTLYAIWKSCNPQVNAVYEYDINVSGVGVVGMGDIGSNITVTFPGGYMMSTYVSPIGTWSVVVPPAARPLLAGLEIKVVQTELSPGKLPSDTVTTVVLP